MLARHGLLPSLAFGLLALAGSGSDARAQGNVFNPYGNSGYADYREFTTPMYSNDPSLPGQARLQNQGIGGGGGMGSRTRANQYEAYTNSLSDTDRNSRPTTASGTSAGRSSRTDPSRVYRPNDTEANRKFQEKMRLRDEQYAKALEEPDLAKRARLLRQLEQQATTHPITSAAARPPASPAARAAAARVTRTPAPGATAPAATTPNRAPAPAATNRATSAPRAPTAPAPAAGAASSPATSAPAATPAPAALSRAAAPAPVTAPATTPR